MWTSRLSQLCSIGSFQLMRCPLNAGHTFIVVRFLGCFEYVLMRTQSSLSPILLPQASRQEIRLPVMQNT